MLYALLTAADFPYQEALPSRPYQFPRDHFEHEDYRTEWWYYTGNLRDRAGHRFGFELVFFRVGERKNGETNASAWRLDDVYLAHAALTDIDGKRFRFAERMNREGPGIAGASFARKRIWNGNWRCSWNGEQQRLEAVTDDFSFGLTLDPAKPFVIQGVNGVSQKAEGAGRASHYVSFTRLKAQGSVNVDGTSYAVDGQAWMDHEWFTEQLDPQVRGWDWFSVQLDDGTDLMLFELRRKDGGIDPYSSGTFVARDGKARHLTAGDFSLHPLETWTSAKTRARYPVKWRVEVPSLKIDVTCAAALDTQELNTSYGNTSYWEGAVTYSGTRNGVGYLEMTGYDKAVKLN